MQVRAAVDEADIGNVTTGQRATFTVDAFPDDVFYGTLSQIRLQPGISSNVVTYTTIINTSNNDLKLKPGMTANITIYTKEDSNALLISARASKFRPDSSMLTKYKIVDQRKNTKDQQTNGVSTTNKTMTTGNNGKTGRDSLRKDSDNVKRAFVWVLNDKTLTRRFIKTGMEDGTQVQVLSGLTSMDEVVDGLQQGNIKGNQTTTERSPFMPARRTNQSGNRPAGTNRPSQ
jgi:HlyD family secretion protein